MVDYPRLLLCIYIILFACIKELKVPVKEESNKANYPVKEYRCTSVYNFIAVILPYFTKTASSVKYVPFSRPMVSDSMIWSEINKRIK